MRISSTAWKWAAGIAIVAAVLPQCADSASDNLSGQDVIHYLNRTIAWYEHVTSLDELNTVPQSAVLQDNVRQSAKQVVQKAFAFARQEAQLAGNMTQVSNTTGSTSGPAQNLQRTSAVANQRVQRLQSEIDDLNRRIAKSFGRARATLISQRDALTAALNLAKQMQKSIGSMLSFASGSQAAGGLLGQINALAESDTVPAALNNAPEATPAGRSNTTHVFQPQSAGILSLFTQSVTLFNAENQLKSAIKESIGLASQIDVVRAPLRTQLRTLISQSDALANSSTGVADPKQLDDARTQIEALSARFVRLSGALTPLAEQLIVLDAARSGLEQWRRALQDQQRSALGYLALRVGSVAFGVVMVLIISEVLRRVTLRYVRDARLRREIVLLKRIGVGCAIALVIIFGIFGGFGSFATVAGFVTAGLAVALQNVILSVVAYFFLIGRYGLRVGDRVTVSGVNGQVIEVGLMRIYLMELAGAGVDIHPTGRVAVFSNSVIFQPAALIKQAPGTEYAWHAVSTTLVLDTDFEAARTRLTHAVETVYDRYRPAIEQQHEAFEQSTNMQVSAPRPVSRVRFIDAGCEILIRYPVELRQSGDTDDAIIQSLFAELEKEPKLKLAPGGAPKIQPAT